MPNLGVSLNSTLVKSTALCLINYMQDNGGVLLCPEAFSFMPWYEEAAIANAKCRDVISIETNPLNNITFKPDTQWY